MDWVEPADPPSRRERRKAATRRAILDAGDRLFAERGYAKTTMEDIAQAADVAIRTIYLHFDSKPAILLAQFDGWLDAFVTAICERPVDEPVDDAVAAALHRIVEQGWVDRRYSQIPTPHPTVHFIGAGEPEIAGHIMQAWVRAQDRIAADYTARSGTAADSTEPWVRAAVVFASWTATILYARAGYARGDLPAEASGNQIGEQLARAISRTSHHPGG